MIIIDGTTYDVPIVSLEESCDFLDKYAERTEDGVLHRELIGTFFNQKIQFGSPVNATQTAQLVLLWAKLSEAVEFHEVTVPDEDGVPFTFNAYFSNVTRKLKKDTATKTFWKNLTVNFIAQQPAATP